MKKVYKVLKRCGDNLQSAIVFNSPWSIWYSDSEWVEPKIGKIFAFESLHAARLFARPLDYQKTEIWSAYTHNYTFGQTCSTSVGVDAIRDFWMDKKFLQFTLPPAATVFCDDLLLIERI